MESASWTSLRKREVGGQFISLLKVPKNIAGFPKRPLNGITLQDASLVLKNIAGFPKRPLNGITLQDASLLQAKKEMEDLIEQGIPVFQVCGTAFMEAHPFTSVDGEPFALDMRGELDDAAPFKNLNKMLLNLVLKNIAGFPKRPLNGITLQDASLAKKEMEDLKEQGISVFQVCGTAFMEAHPFTSVDGEPFALDMRGELDDAAPFKNLNKMLLNLVSSGYVAGNTALCIGELPEEIHSVWTDILPTSTHINFQTQGLCVSSKNRANPPQYTVNHDKSEKGHPVKVFRVTLDQVFHEIGEIYPLALGDAEALHEATRNETLRHNNAGGLFGYPTPNLEDYTVVYYHETADHRLIRLQCPNIEFPWYDFVLLLSGVAVFDGPTGNGFVA